MCAKTFYYIYIQIYIYKQFINNLYLSIFIELL